MATPEPQQKHSKAYDLSEFRVLVIEDAPFISSLMSSALSEMGIGKIYISSAVNDAKEKILSYNAVQSSQNIDVVILDWLMPDVPGKEFLTWVRAHKSDSIKYLPVIVCSAFASTELVEDSRDSGANEVMVKPVSAQKLSNRILHVIDHPRHFISSPKFFGPDRRRKVEKHKGEERRKARPEEIEEEYEQLQ